MAFSSTYAFFHCHYAFQKFPFFCVTLRVLHALQNAALSHSAEHATFIFRYKIYYVMDGGGTPFIPNLGIM